MSFDPIDLAGIHRIVDRHGATPAPTGDGDTLPPALPPTPWQPRVVEKACGCLNGDLCTHPCDTTRDRIELAYAPVVHWLRRAA